MYKLLCFIRKYLYPFKRAGQTSRLQSLVHPLFFPFSSSLLYHISHFTGLAYRIWGHINKIPQAFTEPPRRAWAATVQASLSHPTNVLHTRPGGSTPSAHPAIDMSVGNPSYDLTNLLLKKDSIDSSGRWDRLFGSVVLMRLCSGPLCSGIWNDSIGSFHRGHHGNSFQSLSSQAALKLEA